MEFQEELLEDDFDKMAQQLLEDGADSCHMRFSVAQRDAPE